MVSKTATGDVPGTRSPRLSIPQREVGDAQPQISQLLRDVDILARSTHSDEVRDGIVEHLQNLIRIFTAKRDGTNDNITQDRDGRQQKHSYITASHTTAGEYDRYKAPHTSAGEDESIPLHVEDNNGVDVSPDNVIDALKSTRKAVKRKSDDMTETGHTQKQIKRTALNTRSVNKITKLALTDDCGTADLKELRGTFTRDLVSFEDDSTKNESNIVSFSQEEADDVARFFFDEIMSAKQLERLAELIKAYGADELENKLDVGVRVRASQLATDITAPLTIRKFFGIFSRQQTVHQSMDPHIQQLTMIVHDREVLVEYNRVLEAIRNRDPEIVKYLAANGLTHALGKGWSTLAIDHITELMGVKRSTFKWMCEKAKGVDCLVKEFGEGVIPLLPLGSSDKLRRTGLGKLRAACRILKRHVSSFQFICDASFKYIYNPFIQGEPRLLLDPDRLIQNGSKSFMKLITEAAEGLERQEPESE